MNLFTSTEKTPLSVHFIIIILPFLIFYWMIPFVSSSTMGNDYLRFSIRHQMELMFSIWSGSFPLYIPGFGSGQSSSALTLGQIFHPLPHLASILPGYWGGKAIEWNSFLKLLSLGLTQLALFAFLRRIRLNVLFSFLLSFITVYNLRMISLFRHGAPIEAYTAHLILCAVIGWYFIKPTKWIGPLFIIATTYLLVCSGHPEEMYYGLLGAGLFSLIAPFYLSTMLSDRQVDFRIAFTFSCKVGSFFLLGILLSSAYIIPFFFDFIKANVDRVGQDYAWANSNLDTFIGTINNFFLPLRSDVHGVFGGSTLILLAAAMPALRVFKIKIPRSIWVVWGLLLLMFLFMQGSRTPVHRFLWEILPFASSIRVAGRISMIMPFFIMILLAWVVKAAPVSASLGRLHFTVKPSVVLAYCALLLTIIYCLIYIAGYHMLSLDEFRELFRYPVGDFYNISNFQVDFIIIILGITSLIILINNNIHTNAARGLSILLIIVMALQLGVTLKFRSSLWTKEKYDSPSFETMQKQKMAKLDYLYYPGGGLHSSIVMKQLKRSFIEPFLGKIYTHVIPVADQEEGYKTMLQERLPQQIFVERYDQQKADAITEGAKDMKEGTVKLQYSSFNRLQFHVASEVPAFLGLSYPYTGHWSAWVNGVKAHVYRANGASHAVEIPEGESLIEFRYWSSASFWGMVISFTTFALIGLFVCLRGLGGVPRIIATVIILIISAGGFMLWYNSLYSGDNLETEYAWTYTPPLDTPNIAYGKKSWLGPNDTSVHWSAIELALHNNRFVDGDSRQCSGFISRIYDNPAWVLDLYQARSLKTIVLHESCQNRTMSHGPLNMLYISIIDYDKPNEKPAANSRPLYISLSNDGSSWSPVDSVLSPMICCDPMRIVFDEPKTARYIKIEGSGKSKLMFDEVEVYGP